MNRIGVTETGDPSKDYSWVDRLYDANILITKTPDQKFIEEVMKNDRYKRIIIHITCTGWGGSLFEPNVPRAAYTKCIVNDLIKAGFPVEQLVLRIDPIIPNGDGLGRLKGTLFIFKDLGIKRCRVSMIDLYPHVKDRIMSMNVPYGFRDQYYLPWWSWQVPDKYMLRAIDIIKAYNEYYEFEACAEHHLCELSQGLIKEIGCVSQKDLDVLGCTSVTLEGPSRQRKTCLCPGNKYQLLLRKPSRCSNSCIYCFWK